MYGSSMQGLMTRRDDVPAWPPEPEAEREPPHSAECEQSLLGCLLLENEAAAVVGDSPSSCSEWLMALSGLRISWAMLAESRPSEASLICWARCEISAMPSRKAITWSR